MGFLCEFIVIVTFILFQSWTKEFAIYKKIIAGIFNKQKKG